MSAARRVLAVLPLLAVAGLAMAPAAVGQDALEVTIEQVSLGEDGAAEAVVSVSGTLTERVADDAFTVTEAGRVVAEVGVRAVDDADRATPRTVFLVLDTSGSTEGAPLVAARRAASDFATAVVGVGVHVGVVTFSDEAGVLHPAEADAGTVVAAIDGIVAGGETALHDAVVLAAGRLAAVDGERSMVVFSDGADTASTASPDEAVAAVREVGATVSTVALDTPDLELGALEALASSTGGSLVRAADASGLGDAFGRVAERLTNQYVLAWQDRRAPGGFDVGVTVRLGGVAASDTVALLAPEVPRDVLPAVDEPRVVPVVDPGVFANVWLLRAALAALFTGLLVIVLIVVVPTADQRVARTLERGLRSHRRESESARPARASASLGRRAVGLVDALPKPTGYDEDVQTSLDRAGWPLRASEFTTLRVLAVVVGALVGWGLFGNPLLGLLGAAVGWVALRLLLEQRVAARRTKFLAQLPDTLQLLAGALKAGYGILQGIDTIVKETAEPTASEFRQVLTESRLGLPMEESLEAMADRIDSEDFRWVTVAISIQRRVGGNLAELLETVAETLRGRAMVRRQVAALSAEGRLSGIILTALPVVLAAYMVVVNPAYIGALFSAPAGRAMLLGAVGLMVVGALWMRRLIDIDV